MILELFFVTEVNSFATLQYKLWQKNVNRYENKSLSNKQKDHRNTRLCDWFRGASPSIINQISCFNVFSLLHHRQK
jgi:hypothetical protein